MKDYDRALRGLERTGVIAGVLLILSSAAAFFFDELSPHLMALAVGCGIVVNAVLMICSFLKNRIVRSALFLAVTLMLTVVFALQIF